MGQCRGTTMSTAKRGGEARERGLENDGGRSAMRERGGGGDCGGDNAPSPAEAEGNGMGGGRGGRGAVQWRLWDWACPVVRPMQCTSLNRRVEGLGRGGGQSVGSASLPVAPPSQGLRPPCAIPSGCGFVMGPWAVTRSSLRVLRRVVAF